MQLHGEINVAEVMQRQECLKDWQMRMKRNVEWYALKEYWRADKDDRDLVKHLFGEDLERALLKWKQRYLVVDRQPNT